jgi:hypothetical protein
MAPAETVETGLIMSSIATIRLEIPRPITRKVGRVRLLVRLYVMIEGLAMLVLLLGAAFWLALGLDWCFEPSPALRLGMWAMVLAAAAWVSNRWIFRRLFARLPHASIALILERKFPELRESLVTTVELAQSGSRATIPSGQSRSDRSTHSRSQASMTDGQNAREEEGTTGQQQPIHPAMWQQTSREAADRIATLPAIQVFRIKPLAWKVLGTLVMVASIASFALANRESFGFWVERMQLSQTPWPRRVELQVLGFSVHEGGSANGIRRENVPRDDQYQLEVLASIVNGHKAPEFVEIRYYTTDRRRGRDTMTKVGEALPGRDQAQRYRYLFQHVMEDLELEIVGGDDRVDGLHLRVVERPQIVGISADLQYPDYLLRQPHTLEEVSGRLELPEGTTATIRIESTKRLRRVQVQASVNQQRPIELPVAIASRNDKIAKEGTGGADMDDGRTFAFSLDLVREDQVLLITMQDQEGVHNRIPYRLLVSVVHDLAPEVSVRPYGIGSAVTSQASIPWLGMVRDQYGLDQIWFSYSLDQEAPKRRPMRHPPQRKRTFDQFDQFDLNVIDPETGRLRDQWKPGQQLSISIQASDAYDLLAAEHVGSSQRFLLDIVTPSELYAILEKRELGLRQRFESIYEKMSASSDLLYRIGSAEPIAPGHDNRTTNDDSVDSNSTGQQTNDPARADRVADNLDQNRLGQDLPEVSDRIRRRDRLRVASLLQNTKQSAQETSGVADGFAEIVVELDNNRIGSPELKHRLRQRIAEPLIEIATGQMPDLERLLERFQNTSPQGTSQTDALRTAREQSDQVLLAMKEVLGRMLELESYNELVDLLREITNSQQQLNEKTIEEQRARLRRLLEDE